MTRGEAIIAATAVSRAAREEEDRAALRVAIAADVWAHGGERGEAYLRRKVAAWRAAVQAREVAADELRTLLRTPGRAVLGPLPADSEGGYLREWGAA